MIPLWILCILCVIIIASVLAFMIRKSKDINEAFTEVTLTDSAEQNQRNAFAVEKCSDLLSHDPAIGNNEYNVMNSILNGYRLNKWKPVKDDPMHPLPDKGYCYIYNDRSNNISDFLVGNESPCDISNPLFADNPMITRVFNNAYTDRTHTLPIQKCVIELDPNQITQSNVDRMWTKWGTSHCDLLSKSMRDELAFIKVIRDKARHRYDELVVDEEHMNAMNAQLVGHLGECGQCNAGWKATYGSKQDDYVSAETSLAQETHRLGKIMGSNEVLRNSNQALNDAIKMWNDLWVSQSNLYGTCTHQLNDCRALNDQAFSNYKSANNIYNGLSACNMSLSTEKMRLMGVYDQETGEYAKCSSTLSSESDRKNAMYNQLINVIDWNNTCQQELTHYKSLNDTYTDLYNKTYADYTACDIKRNEINGKLHITKIETVGCATQQGGLEQALIQTQKDFVTQEAALKEALTDLKAHEASLFECSRKKSKLNAVKEGLLVQNVTLYNELEVAYQKLRNAQMTAFDNQKDAIRTSFTASLLGVGAGCQANADEIPSLLNKANQLLGASFDPAQICKSCTPTQEQCEAAWMDDPDLCSLDMPRINKADQDQNLPN